MTLALTLPQALLLLILKDDTGRPKAGFYRPAIAGAAISELLLREQISLSDDKKPKLIPARSPSNQGTFLDFVLAEISASEKQRSLQSWIRKLGNKKSLIPTLADELCELGAVTKTQSTLLGIFTRTAWPEASAKFESNVKFQMQEAIAGTGKVEDRLSVIIALADMANVLRYNFDRGFLKDNKARIAKIKDGDLLAIGATDAAIKAAKAALTAAIVAGVIAPTATSS